MQYIEIYSRTSNFHIDASAVNSDNNRKVTALDFRIIEVYAYGENAFF